MAGEADDDESVRAVAFDARASHELRLVVRHVVIVVVAIVGGVACIDDAVIVVRRVDRRVAAEFPSLSAHRSQLDSHAAVARVTPKKHRALCFPVSFSFCSESFVSLRVSSLAFFFSFRFA